MLQTSTANFIAEGGYQGGEGYQDRVQGQGPGFGFQEQGLAFSIPATSSQARSIPGSRTLSSRPPVELFHEEPQLLFLVAGVPLVP